MLPKNESTLLEIAKSIYPGKYSSLELLNEFKDSKYFTKLNSFYNFANISTTSPNILIIAPKAKDTKLEEKYMTNIATNFTSPTLGDLFDSMPLAEKYFEQSMNEKLLKAVLIGKQSSDVYVTSKADLNKNVLILKNELFNNIVKFLRVRGISIEGSTDLYNISSGKFVNFEKYSEVLKKLETWFKENRTMIDTATQREIPSLSVNLSSNADRTVLDAYNAAIMLSNFDNVIFKKFKNILKLDFSTFNEFDGPLKGNKYEFGTKGLETTYWLGDDQQSESAEVFLDDYSKSIIGLVRVVDKNNNFTGEYLEAKDFYSLASFINTFELENFTELNKDEEWLSLNEDPVGTFKVYLKRILENYENHFKEGILENNTVESQKYAVFKSSINKIKSISEFLEEIKVKEANSNVQPIISVFTQVLNNSFGANYLVNNSNTQETEIKEMHSHNANRVKLFNDLYAFLKARVKNPKNFYIGGTSETKPNLTTEKDFLNKLVNNDDVSDLRFFIHKITGKFLTEDGVERLKAIKGNKQNNGEMNYGSLVDDLHSYLKAVRSPIETGGQSVLQKIIANEDSVLNNEYSAVESNANIIENASKSLQTIFDIYLEDFVLKPITTISTLSGEKIPVWKTPNVMYNDVENLLTRSRVEKSKEHDDNAYENLFVKYGGLKGTSTKLEVINRSNNKASSAYNVAEHFISSFQYEFLNSFDAKKNIDIDGRIHVMIGNYADKSTIVAKMIDRHLKVKIDEKDKFIIGHNEGKNVATQAELQELVRSQSAKYYTGLVNTIFDKYKEIGVTIIDGDIIGNINKINEFLGIFQDQDEFLVFLQKHNVDIVEELDYSTYLTFNNKTNKYDKRLALNQTIVDYSKIYGSKEEFNKFVNFQEDNFAEKLELLKGKNILIGSDGTNGGNFEKIRNNYENYLNSFGITAKEMKNFELHNEDKELVGLKIVNEEGELNPLAKRWMWSNALIRNEYLYITVKPEYMHPHKMKLNFRGDNVAVDYNQFELESSGRLIMQAKRNVSYTGTIERPKRNDRLGVTDNVNVSIIKDLKTDLYNLSGDTHNQEIHDGSSKINYLYSKMVDNSYPGKNYEGTKKQLGTFSNEYGSALKKDAETVLDNKSMLSSNKSSVKLKNLHKKMLSSSTIKFPTLSTSLSLNNTFLRNGEYIRINKISISGTNVALETSTVDPITKKTIKNVGIENYEGIDNLYKLWELLGAEYSVDENLNFSEGSNDLLFNLITHKSLDINDVKMLKSSMIHIASNASAFKSGAINLNPSTVYTDNNKLKYTTFENRHMGPQLDAKHHADASKVKEITQLISALSQNPTTAYIAEEIYNDLARIIEVSSSKYLDNIKDLTPTKRQAFYKQLSQQFSKALATSNETNLASIISSTFKFDDVLPISNQNFFNQFVKTMVTKMNNEFITRYYTGLGVVLNPSHGIIQVYEDVNGNIYQQEDILKKAIIDHRNNPNKLNKSNEQILEDYIQENFKSLPTTWDKIKLGDTVLVSEEVEDYDPLDHSLIADDINIKENTKAWRDDSTKINKTYEFSFVDKPKEIFELVKDLEDDYYSIHFKTSGKDSLTNIEKERLIGNIYSFLPPKAKISTWGDITKGGISGLKRFLNTGMIESGETRTVKSEGKSIELPIYKFPTKIVEKPITLSTPELYYKYKNSTATVSKIYSSPRDLNPSETSFDILENYIDESGVIVPKQITKNMFDLDSIRLRYMFEMAEDQISQKDAIILNNFKTYLQNTFNVNLNNKKAISKYLTAWTNRNLQLMDNNFILPTVNENTVFNDYFGNDDLLRTNFKDVKAFYTQKATPILNYRFKPAEIIMPNIHKTAFDVGDSTISEIKELGSSYFKNKLEKNLYSHKDDREVDFKIKVGKKDVYIKFVSEFPSKIENNNIFDNEYNEKTDTFIKYRLSDTGERLYIKPPNSKILVDSSGNDTIYIKVAKVSRGIDKNGENTNERVNLYDQSLSINLKDNIKALIKSFNGEIDAIIPLMNNQTLKLKKLIIKNGIKMQVPKNLDYIAYNTFVNFTSYKGKAAFDEKLDSDWFETNKEQILNQLANKKYSSWLKHHQVVTARIPAQSMQSFMEMYNIGYLKTNNNDAYVSIWQIWLQGSKTKIIKI